MQLNLSRGFNRLFLLLTAVWVVYCLFVYPMRQRQHAQKILEAELRYCYEHELGKGQEFEQCLKYAELNSGTEMWTAYYARESWFLALIVVIVPMLSYALARALTSVGFWVWRGFTSSQ